MNDLRGKTKNIIHHDDELLIPNKADVRLYLGEAWMWCAECGGKLYSFDGYKDASRGCPYRTNGKCEPK